MVLIQRLKVHSQPRAPGALISRHAQHAHEDRVRRISSVSGNGESRMASRSAPLLDDVAFVALQLLPAFEDSRAGIFFQVLEGQRIRQDEALMAWGRRVLLWDWR